MRIINGVYIDLSVKEGLFFNRMYVLAPCIMQFGSLSQTATSLYNPLREVGDAAQLPSNLLCKRITDEAARRCQHQSLDFVVCTRVAAMYPTDLEIWRW